MANGAAASLQFLGAAGGVTGSKYLFSCGDDQVLIDCGLFQGLKELRQRNWAPVPIDLERLRAVILTHAHIDHSGYLPRLVSKGYKGPVFATPATCDLLGVMLPDAAHLQEEEARYANRKGYSRHTPALPLYRVEDAELSLTLLRSTRIGESVEVAEGVFLEFGRVGHILGAGSARLSFKSNGHVRTLVDSGDLGRYDRPILKDPEPAGGADWLLIESTYGNRSHAKDSESELCELIKATVERRGCLIIPAFAVGRTQELIYIIRKMEDDGEIPVIPVHVDSPMGLEATEIYCRHTDEHDLEMQQLQSREHCPISSRNMVVHRTPEQSKSINQAKGPMVIISASGMATGGRVLHHLKQRLPDPRHDRALRRLPGRRHARAIAAGRRHGSQAARRGRGGARAGSRSRRFFRACRSGGDPALARDVHEAAAHDVHRPRRTAGRGRARRGDSRSAQVESGDRQASTGLSR